jgi:uncharacterized caspase-like protein
MQKILIKYLFTVFSLFAYITTLYGSFKGETYAVIVGVSDYKNFGPEDGDLPFSDRDAQLMYNFLIAGKLKIPKSNVALLIDKNATHKNILMYCDYLFSKATEADRIIFFFSGHGSNDAFCPFDYDSFGNNILSHNSIKLLFRKSKASVKLIFADACMSGNLKTKSLPVKSSAKLQNNRIDSSNSLLNRDIIIMMSSYANQYSIQSTGIDQSVFSYFLIKGLRGAADKNSDRVITISELYYYVRDNTYSFTMKNFGHRQVPIIYGNFRLNMVVSKY